MQVNSDPESRYKALDSLDEIRENAREAFQAYQERIKRHFRFSPASEAAI